MKRIIAAALLLIMLLSLAACTNATNQPEVPVTPAVTEAPEETKAPAVEAVGEKETGKTGISGSKLPGAQKSEGKKEEPKEEEKPQQQAPAQQPEEKPAQQPAQAPEAKGPVPLKVLIAEHYESSWSDKGTKLCGVGWDSLTLSEACARDYPQLFITLKNILSEDTDSSKRFLRDNVEDAQAMAKQQEYFYGFTSQSESYVQRADSLILSVRTDKESYLGGVHPDFQTVTLNFDPQTGEALKLSDVLTDTAGLPALLNERITEKYSYAEFPYLEDQLKGYGEEDYSWTLDYQGITFYFSPYEIASHALGLLTVTVNYWEMPALFEEKYTAAPAGGWAKELPFSYENELDLDGDGDTEILYVGSTVDGEYGTMDLYAAKDSGEQHLKECYGFAMKPFLVCLGGPGAERYFLYVEATAENDYTTLYIYDLNGEKITLNSEVSGAGFPGVWDESIGEYGIWYEEYFNDPHEFTLGHRIDRLGTWTAYKTYRTFPADGALDPQTDYYTLPEDAQPLISAVDLEVFLLPEGKLELIPAGSEFYFRRTDEDTYVVLELEDGRECRMEVQRDGWDALINGMPEYECFKNLMYAG